MRIVVKFEAEKGYLEVPVHYNHLLQSLIYRNLHEGLSTWIHDQGFFYGKRRFKMFTFSRLFGSKMRRVGKKLVFQNPVYFKIGSMKGDILESFALHLIKKGEVLINRQKCRFTAVEVELPLEGDGEILLKAISPITVYSTLKAPSGGKKTYFYTPWEKEFADQIKKNLIRKAVSLYGKAPTAAWEDFLFEPHRVSTARNFAIINFKGTWIKGWTGIYRVRIPKPYFEIAYNAGVGAKNSQGFGMLEVWEKK